MALISVEVYLIVIFLFPFSALKILMDSTEDRVLVLQLQGLPMLHEVDDYLFFHLNILITFLQNIYFGKIFIYEC